MCHQTADFRLGGTCCKILLVGACPGKAEEDQGRPFIGGAGKNLRIMIAALNVHSPDLFCSDDLEDYSLLNAHDLPRYVGRVGYDGNSEPTRDQVMRPENIERLQRHLTLVSPQVVLYLGDTAEFIHTIALKEMPDARFFKTGHPSKPAWNTRPEYKEFPQETKLSRWAVDKLHEIHAPAPV
jgi:uracil-DNA glycosylase